MNNNDDDVVSVLSNFIKGKTRTGDQQMARLTWDGDVPPEFPEIPEVSSNFKEFKTEYKSLVRAISECSVEHCTSVFSGMLTLPELQSNTYRLELLVHLAAIHAKGKKVPTSAQAAAWFNQLDIGTAGRMEDAAEDIFLSNVIFDSGNFRLFEGAAEGNAFYTQIFLDILEEMPSGNDFTVLYQAVKSLLILSENIAEVDDLKRNIVGNPIPVGSISKPNAKVFKEVKDRTLFSQKRLDDLGVTSESLSPFITSHDNFSDIEKYGPNYTPYEFKPIIRSKKGLILALPTLVGVAIRTAIIYFCSQTGRLPLLEQAVSNVYAKRLSTESLLGDLNNVPVVFSDYGKFRACNICTEIDSGRYLHLLIFVDHFDDFEKGAFAGHNPVEPISDFVKKSIDETSADMARNEGFKEGITLIIGCGWGRGLAIGLPESPKDWRSMFLSAHDLFTLGRVGSFTPLDIWRIQHAEHTLNSMNIFISNGNGFLNWTCPVLVPDTYLIYATNLSKARGLFPPSVECLRRGL